MEAIIVIIIIASIINSLTSKKNKPGQNGKYEKTGQGKSSTGFHGVDEALDELKRHIEETAGVLTSGAGASSGSHASKKNLAPKQRGGTRPKHHKITADTSERTGNRIDERRDESRHAISLAARKAEIAESVAYWEENRLHMAAINNGFNEEMARQHREMHQGMEYHKVKHSK